MEEENKIEETKVENPVEAEEPKKKEASKVEKAEKVEKKEEKTEPSEEVKVDLEKLKAELEEANKKVSEMETLTGTVTTLKEEVNSKDAIIKEYEELISNLIETKLKDVPEEYKELIPDNLNLKQKLNWLDKAEAKGIFHKEEKKKPTVEIGKPLNVDVPQVDTSKLSGSQLLKMAYNTIRK